MNLLWKADNVLLSCFTVASSKSQPQWIQMQCTVCGKIYNTYCANEYDRENSDDGDDSDGGEMTFFQIERKKLLIESKYLYISCFDPCLLCVVWSGGDATEDHFEL